MLFAVLTSFVLAVIFSLLFKALLPFSEFLLEIQNTYFIHPMMGIIWLVAIGGLFFSFMQWFGLVLEQRKKPETKITLFLKIFSKISGRNTLTAECLSPKTNDPALVQTVLEASQRQDKHPLLVIEFFIWVLPLLGFIGTIIGISGAMEKIGFLFENNQAGNFKPILVQLATAFYTTLLALLSVIPLMVLLYVLQAETEKLQALRQHLWQDKQT